MKCKFLLLFLFSLITMFCYSQIEDSRKPNQPFQTTSPINVTEVNITDTTLRRIIGDFIDYTTQRDSTFTKAGYLTLRLKSKSDSTNCYYLNQHYDILYPDDPDERFPSHYSFVKGKLVIIDIDKHLPVIHSQYDTVSKRRYLKILYKYTGIPEIQYAPNEKGEIMTLRPTGNIMRGGGLNICFKRDGTSEITKPLLY